GHAHCQSTTRWKYSVPCVFVGSISGLIQSGRPVHVTGRVSREAFGAIDKAYDIELRPTLAGMNLSGRPRDLSLGGAEKAKDGNRTGPSATRRCARAARGMRRTYPARGATLAQQREARNESCVHFGGTGAHYRPGRARHKLRMDDL